jgi:hypothetical protein
MRSSLGGGTAPAVIWAASSAWMLASLIVAPLRPAAGAIWTAPANAPRPSDCGGDAVSYSSSQSYTPELTTSV